MAWLQNTVILTLILLQQIVKLLVVVACNSIIIEVCSCSDLLTHAVLCIPADRISKHINVTLFSITLILKTLSILLSLQPLHMHKPSLSVDS